MRWKPDKPIGVAWKHGEQILSVWGQTKNGKIRNCSPVGRHLDTLQVYGNGWAVRTSVFFPTFWRSGSGWQNTSQSKTAQSFSTSHLDPLSIACNIRGSIVQSNFDYFNHPVPVILTLMSTVAPGCVLLCQYMGKMAANECASKGHQ